MKSYNQALNEIYQKAQEKTAQLKRRRKIMLTVIPICFILSLSIGIFFRMSPPTVPDDGSQSDGGMNTRPGNDDSLGDGSNQIEQVPTPDQDITNAEPSIYPGAWKDLNAVLVKWGEMTDATWWETWGGPVQESGTYIVEYVGVSVEFLEVYSETMTESLIDDIEKTISETTYLLIPKEALDQIVTGGTSLVFIDRQAIIHRAEQDADGTHYGEYEDILGVRLGDWLSPGEFVPAPIFTVRDGKVEIPESAYLKDKNQQYYMRVIQHLCRANDYIDKKGENGIAKFENGITVEELGKYFSYISSTKDY